MSGERKSNGSVMNATVLFLLVVLAASGAMAGDDPKPTLAICKADLKSWSAQKTETLTIGEIDARMTEMVACADLAKKHEKKMRKYLDEFYRVHSELATRAFDFILRHNLQGQFGEEEGGKETKVKSTTRERSNGLSD